MGCRPTSSGLFNFGRKDVLMKKAPSIITREGHSVGKTEEFKRPNHNDFRLSSELKKTEFSGIRHNSITNCQELWIMGELKASMAMEEIAARPDAWDNLYRDVFGFHSVKSINE